MEYYFDIETTGLNPIRDKIVTIQYQPLSQVSGIPLTKLVVMKEWDDGSSEEMLLEQARHLLVEVPRWSFVPVGNNLNFDFAFISERMKRRFNIDIFEKLICRPFIDIKHVLVVMNGGNFRNYGRVMGKTEVGSNVPIWYRRGEYERIVRYVGMEAEAFMRTYGMLKRRLRMVADMIV